MKNKRLYILAILVVVALSIVLFQLHRGTKNPITKEQSAFSPTINKQLQNKNYEGYQDDESIYIGQYINNKQYTDAKKLLDDIKKKVPQDQWTSLTYMQILEVDIKINDINDYKKYANSAISVLNKKGDKIDANYFSDQLKKYENAQ